MGTISILVVTVQSTLHQNDALDYKMLAMSMASTYPPILQAHVYVLLHIFEDGVESADSVDRNYIFEFIS